MTANVSLPAVPASVRAARVLAADAAAALGASERIVDDVRLCVGEAVANVVCHAYAGAGVLELDVERQGEELIAMVRDDGVGMERTSGREQTEGGYGLKIIERLALRVSVSSAEGEGTEVRMAFPLGPPDGR